jgi:hypothetical protein
MALEFSGMLTVDLVGTTKNTMTDGTVVTDAFSNKRKATIANGTGSRKAQICYHDQFSLTTNATKDIDLTDIASVFGKYSFSKVKAIYVELVTATAGYYVYFKPGANNAWHGPLDDFTSNGLKVGAESRFFIESPIDGWAVGATEKECQIHNPTGGTVVVKLAIIGEGSVS